MVATSQDGVDLIELHLDDGGRELWGFGIAGNRTMGVYVKAIRSGSSAEKDGRLRVGDQLLQVDDVDLGGLTSEQVARIIRLSHQANDGRVRLLVCHSGQRVAHHNMCRPRSLHGDLGALAAEPDDAITDHAVSKSASQHELPTQASVETRVSPRRHSNKVAQYPRGAVIMRSLTDESFTLVPPVTSVAVNDGPSNSQVHAPAASINAPKQMNASPNIPPQTQSVLRRKTKVSHSNSQGEGSGRAWSSENGRRSSSFLEMRHIFRKSPRNTNNDEQPLVAFDQLSRSSSHLSSVRGDSPNSNLSLADCSLDAGEVAAATTSGCSHRSSNGSQRISWHCPVCLDGVSRNVVQILTCTQINRSKRRLMSTVCGHVFCDQCLRNVILKSGLCPTCRAPVRPVEIHPIFM